jgi:hypothetical protein
VKKFIFAFPKEDYERYSALIYTRRTRVISEIEELLKEKDPNEWFSLFSLLCEYVSVLYHFENALEEVPLRGEWDDDKNYWLLKEQFASRMAIYISSEEISRSHLLSHNISFVSH